LVTIKTKGDKIIDTPLSRIGGKGLFVKEIEEALLKGEIDLAVHSMKDMPTELPDGLHIGAVPKREDPRDLFVSLSYTDIENLPEGARIGTSSLRRVSQLLHLRPDLEIISIRGNIDTRIKKIKKDNLYGIVVAAAAVLRLKLKDFLSKPIPIAKFIPAAGQGALAIETRLNDKKTNNIISAIDDKKTRIEIEAERAFLKFLQGGCQVPIGVFAKINDNFIEIEGVVGSLDGKRLFRDSIKDNVINYKKAGESLAKKLLNDGADRILKEIYGNGENKP